MLFSCCTYWFDLTDFSLACWLLPDWSVWQCFVLLKFCNRTRNVFCTCSHWALPGQPQESFLLQDKTATNEDAGADRQHQADVEVILPPVLTHGDTGCVRALSHIDHQARKVTAKCTIVTGPNPYLQKKNSKNIEKKWREVVYKKKIEQQQEKSQHYHNDPPSPHVTVHAGHAPSNSDTRAIVALATIQCG